MHTCTVRKIGREKLATKKLEVTELMRSVISRFRTVPARNVVINLVRSSPLLLDLRMAPLRVKLGRLSNFYACCNIRITRDDTIKIRLAEVNFEGGYADFAATRFTRKCIRNMT